MIYELSNAKELWPTIGARWRIIQRSERLSNTLRDISSACRAHRYHQAFIVGRWKNNSTLDVWLLSSLWFPNEKHFLMHTIERSCFCDKRSKLFLYQGQFKERLFDKTLFCSVVDILRHFRSNRWLTLWQTIKIGHKY